MNLVQSAAHGNKKYSPLTIGFIIKAAMGSTITQDKDTLVIYTSFDHVKNNWPAIFVETKSKGYPGKQ